MPLGVALAAGLVAVVMAVGPQLSGSGGTPSPTVTVTTTATVGSDAASGAGQVIDVARRTPGDPLALGAVDAPVVMVEYSDFACPYCAAFATTTEPALVKKYVDTGVLRIEWRDFPYLTDQSGVAAFAARVAGQHDKFWAFHDALFATMHSSSYSKLDKATLDSLARAVGIDETTFVASLTDAAVADAVSSDLGEGQKIGVTGTPSFVINGRLVVGAQPLAAFEQAIDQAAAAAK